MRRSALFAAALAASAMFVPTPAHAAGGKVELTVGGGNPKVGDGYLVTSVCSAHSTPGPGEVTVITSVWCEINGFRSATITLPGNDAVVVNANATSRPVVVCVHGQATFSPTIGAPYVVNEDKCWTIVA